MLCAGPVDKCKASAHVATTLASFDQTCIGCLAYTTPAGLQQAVFSIWQWQMLQVMNPKIT